MGKWTERARQMGDNGEAVFSADRAFSSPSEPKDTKGAKDTREASPVMASRQWRAALEALDPARPPQAMAADRWAQLLGDALWIARNYGEQAARDSWTAADLFGVQPSADGWGGVAERLRGSRSLMMTSERAGWRRLINGEPEDYVRGAQPALRPVWEGRE